MNDLTDAYVQGLSRLPQLLRERRFNSALEAVYKYNWDDALVTIALTTALQMYLDSTRTKSELPDIDAFSFAMDISLNNPKGEAHCLKLLERATSPSVIPCEACYLAMLCFPGITTSREKLFNMYRSRTQRIH
jgi:hypothetical protein